MRKVISIGESVLDTVFVNRQPVKAMVGGRIANATASLGMTGVPVTFCSECGTDSVGDMIVDFFVQHQVNTKSIDRYTEGSTPLSAIFSDHNGQEKIVNYGVYPPGERFNVVWPRIDEDDIVLFGSLYAIDAPQRESLYELLSYAAERKAILVYLPGFQHGINFRITRVMTAILENFELSGVIVAHERDIADIFPGESGENAYHNHLEYYCPCFIYIHANGNIDTFVGKQQWHFTNPNPMSDNWLGWQSGFTAGVVCALLSQGIGIDDIPNLDHDAMQQIISTALQLADNAAAHNNCIDEPTAQQMKARIEAAQTEAYPPLD